MRREQNIKSLIILLFTSPMAVLVPLFDLTEPRMIVLRSQLEVDTVDSLHNGIRYFEMLVLMSFYGDSEPVRCPENRQWRSHGNASTSLTQTS